MQEFDEFDIFNDSFYKDEHGLSIEDNDISIGFEQLIHRINSTEEFPLLFSYLNQEQGINKEKFLNYVLNNFEKISDTEFDLINKNFFVRDYIETMFNHVLDNNVLITQEQFIEFLHEDKKHFNHFKKDYQQQLITYYAFNHFDTINDYQWKLIFEPVYEYDYRHLFANISFRPESPVLNTTFWSYFTPQSNIVTSYLEHITTNNLHKSMSFMCEHFGDYVYHYLHNNFSEKKSHDSIILEKHYIYHNPKNCNTLNLTYKDLYQVFGRIYKSMPDKDLTSTNNKDFYNNLENGVYYLFDYISQTKPENIRHLFEKRPKILEFLLNDLHNFSYKTLNPQFQPIFFKHVFVDNIDLAFNQNDCIKKIISGKSNSTKDKKEIETPIQQFLKQHIELLPNEDKQHLIFKLVKNNVEKFNMPLLIEQLMIFSIDSLKTFSQNINVYLNIINDSCECSPQFDEIKESINKSIINKKLTDKFKQDIPNKAKRIKI